MKKLLLYIALFSVMPSMALAESNMSKTYLNNIVTMLEKDDGLTVEIGEINPQNESYLIQNYQKIKEKLTSYNPFFKVNRTWFMFPTELKPEFTQNLVIDEFKEKPKTVKVDTQKDNEITILVEHKEGNDNQSVEIKEPQQSTQQASDIQSQDVVEQEKYNGFSENEEKVNFFEIFAYDCLKCLRLHDAIIDYQSNHYVDLTMQPIALKDKDGGYVILDVMTYLTLQKAAINYDGFQKLNNTFLFDVVNRKVDFNGPFNMFKWLKKQEANKLDTYEDFKKAYFDKELIKQAKYLVDKQEKMPYRTIPMLVINNKFVLLQNIVSSGNSNYDDEITLGAIDYMSTLAILEREGLVKIGIAEEKEIPKTTEKRKVSTKKYK